MKVAKGQILAKLDASNVEAGLHLAEAQLASSKMNLAETEPMVRYTEAEWQRLAGLENTKAVSKTDRDKAEAEFESQKAKLERQKADVVVAERQVDDWKQQLDDTIIRAPFAGVVTTKDSQPGEMISPMSAGGFTRTGICTLVDMASLEIEVDVGESFINRVKEGQAVVTDPTVLLCDEPTGDLDRKSGDEILSLLQTLNAQYGKTIIMVTHDPHASAKASRTVYLDKGQLSNTPGA